jgi:hypothetical protein
VPHENVRPRFHARARGLLGRAALSLALALPIAVPSSAYAATPEEKAAARSLATQGAEALNGSKFAQALDLVTRAEAIIHAPTHLLMIARAQVGLGKLVAAQETYLKLIRENLAASAPAAFKNAQATAKDELAAIEPKIAALRIVVDGLGTRKATVKMDDQPVPPALLGVHRPVDPGKHDVAVYPVGGSPVQASIVLGNGEKKDIRLVVPEGPPPSGVPTNPTDNPDARPGTPTPGASGGGFMTPMRGAGIGVGAVGLGGVVVGAVFMAKAGGHASDADALFEKCNPGCSKAQQGAITDLDKKAASSRTIGIIGLAAGGVAIAGSVVLIVLGKPRPAAAPTKAGVEPWFGGASAGLRGRF